MIGIRSIGIYIPQTRINNLEPRAAFALDENFIKTKIGITSVARKGSTESCSELCCKAYENLQIEESGICKEDIDFICLCTQNGDYHLPHTSPIIQNRLGLSPNCASFDLSLGCSGYVYSLNVAKSFMESQALKNGLVFTCDPYSKIINPEDKNTSLIFGDAASVTLLTQNPIYNIEQGTYFTDGAFAKSLIKRTNEPLDMNGRQIFNFVMRHAPKNIRICLEKNNLSVADIDMFIFHQASRYIIQNLSKRLNIDEENVPFDISEYGNTVSSSIPIILQKYLSENNIHRLLLSGFGVGLSLASVILERRKM